MLTIVRQRVRAQVSTAGSRRARARRGVGEALYGAVMTTWEAVLAAVGLALSGERERGGAELLTCWQDSADDEHAQRCVLAHYLADLEDDVDDEVAWDERALAAHATLGRGDLVAVGIADAAGMAPSLHLNLGDGYLRQGRVEAARAQLDAGLVAGQALRDDGYGAMVRRGLDGLSARLAAATPAADGEQPEEPEQQPHGGTTR